MVQNQKVVELNSKYRRPPLDWIISFKGMGVKFHLGSDAHSLRSVGCFENINHLIAEPMDPYKLYVAMFRIELYIPTAPIYFYK